MERWMLAWSIRALLMAAGTGMVVAALRVRSAMVLHRAWAAVAAAMLLLPAWTGWGPKLSAPILPAATTPVWVETIETPPELRETAAAPASAVALRNSTAAVDWRQAILAVYLGGVTVMLIRLIRGTMQAHRLMRSATGRDGLATSAQCATPVTVGWLRPVLLLPEGWERWPGDQLDVVLLHEREHARRRDPLVQWVALLNRCVFWFHPLAWWLAAKLAALAEEACDQAVLAHGVDRHEYARQLIEMARSVNAAGVRVTWAGCAGFAAGNLSRRVRRILEAPEREEMSRIRGAAAAGLCGLVLASLLACNMEKTSRPARGRTSMAEQQRRELAAAKDRNREGARISSLVRDASMGLTPERAKAVEAEIKADPENPYRLIELVTYYRRDNDTKTLNALTMWYIAEHPEQRGNWGQRPQWDQVWDQGGYERGRQLWAEQLTKSWDNPYVYMNAAEYLSGNDNDRAEEILLEGQRRFPSAVLHWEVFLARHYAWTLVGAVGQLSPNRSVVWGNEPGTPPVDGAYAKKIRASLIASKDVELLDRMVEQLQASAANRDFAESLVDRMFAIDPQNRQAHMWRDDLRLAALQQRAKTGGMSEADRMMLLVGQIGRPRSEGDPNELVALASLNRANPDYGTAVFVGHLALGEAAMERGDRAGALHELAAAGDAPVTDYMRYHQIDMSLPRKLVDAGDRTAVAKFLDRCAEFNRTAPFAKWSAEIRKGENPRLGPSWR
jgi:beta-lactamase regulating signal transducer with metallopeptidase domain